MYIVEVEMLAQIDLTMFLTFFNSVDIPPNHLQVVPGHYHGDGSKLLFLCAMLRVVKSSIAQKA